MRAVRRWLIPDQVAVLAIVMLNAVAAFAELAERFARRPPDPSDQLVVPLLPALRLTR